jgi:hypothetical protein
MADSVAGRKRAMIQPRFELIVGQFKLMAAWFLLRKVSTLPTSPFSKHGCHG